MGIKIVQERVGNDATIPGLPHVLFVALEQPSALDGQHAQDVGAAGRGRFDGAGRVEIAEPETVMERCPL